MSKEIQKHIIQDEVTDAIIIDYLDTMGLTRTAPENSKKMFLQVSKACGLNPFKRESYLVGYGSDEQNWAVITGYEVYIKRANLSGRLDGWKVEINGSASKGDLRAKVIIFRKDFSQPFEWEVWYHEVCGRKKDGSPNAMWRKTPVHMTKKVAIAQGFRLCFPEELAGMPYTSDELSVETHDISHEEIKESTGKQPKKADPVPVPEPSHKQEEMPDFLTQQPADNGEALPWEGAEEAKTEAQPATPAEDEDMITKSQIEIIKQMLSSPHLTSDEKAYIEGKMGTYTRKRAESNINALIAKIKERKDSKQAA